MRLNKFILSMTLLFGASWVYAGDYRSELSFDVIDTGNSEIFGLNGRYHFDEVNTNNVPFSEAAFLGRSSSVFGSYSYENSNLLGPLNTFLIGAEYYKNNIFISPVLLTTDLGDSHFSTIAANVGYLPIDGLRLSTFISHQGYDLNLRLKYVRPHGDNKAFNIEAEFFILNDKNTYSIKGDYYFSQKTSLGIGFRENINGSDASFRVNHFFTPKFRTDLVVKSIDSSGEDDTAIGLGISFRF